MYHVMNPNCQRQIQQWFLWVQKTDNCHLAGETINWPALSEGQLDNLGQESQNIYFPFDLISYSGPKKIIRGEAKLYV